MIHVDVRSCARCGQDHEKLEFKLLTNPIPDGDFYWTHWASCPTNGEPVLLYIFENKTKAEYQP